MGKVNYDGITFDSELEVNYYQYLQELIRKGEVLYFIYHPLQIPNLIGKRSYTPDFCVIYGDRIEIVETKGYSPYSKMIDDAIHAAMLTKSEEWLRDYAIKCLQAKNITDGWLKPERVVYKKVKFLKAYGFVDWDFKNPNTLANMRKEKILTQKEEIKELRDFKKNAERYFTYHIKLVNNEKLTKPQREWYCKYVEELKAKYFSRGKEDIDG